MTCVCCGLPTTRTVPNRFGTPRTVCAECSDAVQTVCTTCGVPALARRDAPGAPLVVLCDVCRDCEPKDYAPLVDAMQARLREVSIQRGLGGRAQLTYEELRRLSDLLAALSGALRGAREALSEVHKLP